MERHPLILRHLRSVAEHLARSRKIKPAARRQILDRREQKMRAVDVGIQSGELIVKRVADETLGGQVIAFLRLGASDHLVQTGIAFQ